MDGFFYGVDEDRTREQFTARVTRHPAGKPGHVYVAQDVAYLRANSLAELEALFMDWHTVHISNSAA